MGGLSKKAWQLRQVAADSGLPFLAVDAGNLLFKGPALSPGQEAQEKLTATAIAEAYSRMGFTAAAVGALDLAAGPDFLQNLAKGARFSWLSANLCKSASNKPLFKESLTVSAGGLRLGIIALTGPAAAVSGKDGIVILPWEQVLPSLAAKMAKGHDLTILLSNLPAADNQRIAASYPNIQVLVQSGITAALPSPSPTNNTLLLGVAPKGKQLGILEITWQASRQWQPQASLRLRQAQDDLRQVQGQLEHFPGGADQEALLRDQPGRLQAWQGLHNRQLSLQQTIATLSREVPAQPAGAPYCTFANRMLDLEKAMPDSAEIQAILTRLDEAIHKLAPPPAAHGSATDSPYLGANSCGQCHPSQLASWRRTRHAQAYQTLIKANQHKNPRCLPCHVTGISLHQGGEALSLPDPRRGVGCETCHGPGRQHSTAPTSNRLTRQPAPSLCQTCHIAPHDPDFDFTTQIRQVGHQ